VILQIYPLVYGLVNLLFKDILKLDLRPTKTRLIGLYESILKFSKKRISSKLYSRESKWASSVIITGVFFWFSIRLVISFVN
jgi:hypothetical protein